MQRPLGGATISDRHNCLPVCTAIFLQSINVIHNSVSVMHSKEILLLNLAFIGCVYQ